MKRIAMSWCWQASNPSLNQAVSERQTVLARNRKECYKTRNKNLCKLVEWLANILRSNSWVHLANLISTRTRGLTVSCFKCRGWHRLRSYPWVTSWSKIAKNLTCRKDKLDLGIELYHSRHTTCQPLKSSNLNQNRCILLTVFKLSKTTKAMI